MSRVPQLRPDQPDLDEEQRDLLDQTRKQLGRVPNLYATIANAPAVLRGYLALREALTGGALTDRVREQLALLTAEGNGCAYCVAAHTFRGQRLLHMTGAQLQATRQAHDDDPHTNAVLQAAQELLRGRGRISDAQLDRARQAGVTDGELMEIVGHIALNVLSNYANHLAEPDLDFPPVPLTAGPAMASDWQHADVVELVDGYDLADADGVNTTTLSDVDVAFRGGFLHIRRPGDDLVQTVSAPAVLRIRQSAGTTA